MSYSVLYLTDVDWKLVLLSRDILGPSPLSGDKNIPQFDHMYNFRSQKSFEKRIKKIGFKIFLKKIILHEDEFQKIGSNNVFYILKK